MARTNRPVKHAATTYEGGVADPHQKPFQELERAVATCLLFERTYYESGLRLAQRIASLCDHVTDVQLSELAVRARNEWRLRHVPLWLCRQLARLGSPLTSKTMAVVIQRPDEMTEFLSLYWKSQEGRTLSKQVKLGLRLAYEKFSPYQLAKWNRDGEVKLRDVLFMVHAVPSITKEEEADWKPSPESVALAINRKGYQRGHTQRHRTGQGEVFRKLIDGELEPPDTWEVALSAGANKLETWTRLLEEKKLGQMALLMNLRNMKQAKVPDRVVREAILSASYRGKALPFRYVTAARHAPHLADVLSEAMLNAIDRSQPLGGKTAIIVDVSASMDAELSGKSTMSRMDVGAALAVLVREVCESVRVFSFSHQIVEVMNVRGLPLVTGILNSQAHGGTYLGAATTAVMRDERFDRILVVTDEQAHDSLPKCGVSNGYLINVAPYQPALPAKHMGWTRISGWSERIMDWIHLEEEIRTSERVAR